MSIVHILVKTFKQSHFRGFFNRYSPLNKSIKRIKIRYLEQKVEN